MMAGLDASMAASAKKASFTASSIGAGFATLGKGVGTALAVVGVAAVKMAVDFDDSLHKAGAVAEATDAQMADWGKTVLDMSTKFPESAKDMAEALYWIKSDMPDATDAEQFKTLEIATKGAVGGVAELGDATEALIVVQNAYAQSGVELAGPKDYMDAMMVSVQRGSITLQDFVANMGKVTGTAAMAKVPFTEISAAVSTLTRKAVPAETAFMALNQTMMTYLHPTAEAADIANQLGIDFTLTGLRTKGLSGAMMELAEKVPDTELANLFPNIRALKAVLPLAGVSVQDFASDLGAMGERAGTTDDMFKVQSESMKNKFIVTLNDLKKVLIEVGEKAFPTLEKAAEGLGRIFKGQNEIFNDIGGGFKTAGSLALSFAGALTSVKPAVYGLIGALAGLKLVGLFSTGPSSIAGGFRVMRSELGKIPTALEGTSGNLSRLGSVLGMTSPLITAVGATGLIAAAGLAEFIAVTWDDEQAAQATADAHVKLIESHGKLAESTLPLVAKLEELRKKQSELAAGTPEYAAAQQEITSLQNQIAGNFPSVVAGWDSERNAILMNTEEIRKNLLQRMALAGVKTTPGAPVEYQGLEAILSKTEKAGSRFTQMTGQVKGLNSALAAAGVETMYLGDVTDAWYESGDKGATVTTMLMSQLKDAGQLTTNEFKNLTGRVSELRNESNIWGGSLGYLNTQIKTLGPQWTAAVAEMASGAREAGKAGAEIPKYVSMAFMSAVPEMQTAGVQAMSAYLQGVGAAAGLLPETAGNLAQQLFNTGTFTATGVAAVDQALQAIANQIAQAKFDKTVELKMHINIFKTPTDMFKDIMSGQTAEVEAKVNVDTAQASQNVTGLKANMDTIQDKGVTASTETAQASQNVSGLKANIAGLTDKTITITANTVTGTISSPFVARTPYEIGKWLAEGIDAGYGAEMKPLQAVATAFSTATTKNEEDIFAWEQQIAETERQIAELKKQGAAEDDARIKNLEAQRDIQQNEKDLIDKTYQVSYAGINRQLEKQNELIEEAKTKADDLKQKEEEAARKREEAIGKWKDGLNSVKSGIEAIISKQESYLSKLGSMKLTGEGGAADRAFSQDQESKALQYQIMQAEDAHNYALANKLTLQKEALDRKKEEEALAPAALTREKEHYAIEKLLADQQEMSYKKIRAEILRIQNSLKTKYAWVSNITKALGEQIKTVKELKKEYDKLNKTKPAGSAKVASLATPSGGGTTVVHVNSILDGKVVAKSVTKILGGNASAYAASGGRY